MCIQSKHEQAQKGRAIKVVMKEGRLKASADKKKSWNQIGVK